VVLQGIRCCRVVPAGGTGIRQVRLPWPIGRGGPTGPVIDFDKATRDPGNPNLPLYDSCDHLHPSDAGYKAMADAIDLSLFH